MKVEHVSRLSVSNNDGDVLMDVCLPIAQRTGLQSGEELTMFTSQNTFEQIQENSDLPVWHSPLCAWCLSEQGIPAGEGSHGICKQHANRLLLQRRQLHSRRIATSA